MDKLQHTPAPWTWKGSKVYGGEDNKVILTAWNTKCIDYDSNNGESWKVMVERLERIVDKHTVIEPDANIRLAHKAPEMYNLIIQIHSALEDKGDLSTWESAVKGTCDQIVNDLHREK